MRGWRDLHETLPGLPRRSPLDLLLSTSVGVGLSAPLQVLHTHLYFRSKGASGEAPRDPACRHSPAGGDRLVSSKRFSPLAKQRWKPPERAFALSAAQREIHVHGRSMRAVRTHTISNVHHETKVKVPFDFEKSMSPAACTGDNDFFF